MRTCCVVLPLVPLVAGERIDRRAWPPHITLIGDVGLEDDGVEDATSIVQEVAGVTAPLSVVVGPEARFGDDGTVLVDRVDSDRLRGLHDRTLDALEDRVPGLVVVEPRWARDGYQPHRTVTVGPGPSPGDVLIADSVAVVELDPGGVAGTGVVLAVLPLGR